MAFNLIGVSWPLANLVLREVETLLTHKETENSLLINFLPLKKSYFFIIGHLKYLFFAVFKCVFDETSNFPLNINFNGNSEIFT